MLGKQRLETLAAERAAERHVSEEMTACRTALEEPARLSTRALEAELAAAGV